MDKELKEALEASNKTIADLRSEVDALNKRSADYLDKDKLQKAEADLAGKLQAEQEKRSALEARLEKLETGAARPGVGQSETEDAHTRAFHDFVTRGVEPGQEVRSMVTNIQVDGGVLVPQGMRDGLQQRLRRSSPLRQLATVVVADVSSYDILLERGDAGYEWGGETQTPSETDTPTIHRISIGLHELSAMPKVSQRLLDQASFDIESMLTARIADRFARAEAAAFVSGDGVNKPKGFGAYATSTADDASRAVQTLQHRITGGAGDFAASNPADVLTNVFYDLQGAYQANANWLMKNTTAARVATLKDGDGSYLLKEILNSDGAIVRGIHGRPLRLADDMPAIGAGANAIAVGDFAAGYTIVDGASVRVLRDPFSAKPFILFYTTKRVGGGVTDFDAIKLVKFANS